MLAADVIWGDPPPAPYRSLRETIGMLQERPGEWALVHSNTSTGVVHQYKVAGCEVTTRGIKGSVPHRVDIWARWPRR